MIILKKRRVKLTKILIIGATGSLGSVIRHYFLNYSTDKLTLMSRHIDQLSSKINPAREKIIQGSVLNSKELKPALVGQDLVIATLSGNLPLMAQTIVSDMNKCGIKRLIFISSMGIYDEIPDLFGASGNLSSNPALKKYRDATDIVEGSNLEYTIIRPGWFDNGTDLDYQITKKGEPFGGHDVSRLSIADLVLKIAHDHSFANRESIGINRIGS